MQPGGQSLRAAQILLDIASARGEKIENDADSEALARMAVRSFLDEGISRESAIAGAAMLVDILVSGYVMNRYDDQITRADVITSARAAIDAWRP